MGLVGDEPYEQEVAAAGTGLSGRESRRQAGKRSGQKRHPLNLSKCNRRTCTTDGLIQVKKRKKCLA